MSDETRKLQEEARKFWDKAVGYLKTVPGKVDETVRKTAESSVLRYEIVGQRRELDLALKELGRRVYDLIELQGAVTPEELQYAIQKVKVHEKRIAEKERKIAELDASAAQDEKAGSAPGPRPARKKSASAPKTARKATKKTTRKAAAKKTAKKSAKKTTGRKAAAKKTASKKTASKRRSVARKTPKK